MKHPNKLKLNHLHPNSRWATTKSELPRIPAGAKVEILALPNAKIPIFEVIYKEQIFNIPIDYFSSMYLSDEILDLFPRKS